jgi:penicillin amidase
MKLFRYLILALLVVAVVIAAIIFRSRPQYQGKLEVLNVQEDTEVLFDTYGIPHIYAASGEDAYKALGYVHAQERLFQMELLRRAGAGTLAEVLGPELVPVDRFFRTLGVNRKAVEEAARLRSSRGEVLRLAEAYLEGVNTYIKEGRLPLEHKLAGIPRKEFTLEDMYCTAGAMSFNFAQGLRTDPLLTHIKDHLGPDYLRTLQYHTGEFNENVPVFPEKVLDPDPLGLPSPATQALKILFESGVPTLYGSNTWAIAPWKTEDGVTLLANDTHIGYAQPCTWYEAHLEYPGQRVYGNFMGGIPFALTGHNDRLAWGVTMLLNDDMDLYCERLDSDSSRYYFQGQWRGITEYKDTIKVKGESSVYLTSRASHHGPLVSEFVQHADSIEHLSLSWTFLKRPCELLEAFYGLNTAQSMNQAKRAVAKIAAPGLNISYADNKGNIALWAAGHMPIRPEHTDPVFLLDGVNGQDEIDGYNPFSENPSLENPPWGFIYSSNNQHDSYLGGPLEPGYYEPDQRAERLVQKLGARNDWSIQAMKRLSMDDHSQYHEDLCIDLVNFIRSQRLQLSELEFEAFENLKDWEGEHHEEDIAPSIYYRWVYKIMSMSMQDELGEEGFKAFLQTNVVKHSMASFICAEDSPWWDDITTKDEETKEEIITRAFRLTIEKLGRDHGEDVTTWAWGNTHQTVHQHAFKELPLVGKWLAVGPMSSPGAIETVNNSVFDLSDDAVIMAKYGPQMRRVINLNDIENSQSILPTGQSGMRMSPHYEDQAEMYIKGKFRPQLMDRSKIERQSQTLLFKAPR